MPSFITDHPPPSVDNPNQQGILNFVLFNDVWSQKGHSASNTTVILASSSYYVYYHHFRDHVLTFISITNPLYFLIQVYFFEEGKNMGIIT